MEPTYPVGARVTVSHSIRTIRRNDVVAFNPPAGSDNDECGNPLQPANGQPCARPTPKRSSAVFVKRVVGLPGDRLKVIRGRTYVDGRAQPESFIRPDAGCEVCNLPKEISVPPGYVFVMGDNRGQSADSRSWGPVRTTWIIGPVVGRAGR
jgi:signal peptidase I